MPGLSFGFGFGLTSKLGSVGVPAGYSLTRFNGQQVYFDTGVLNLTSGRRVYDNGVSLFVAG